VFCRLEQAGWEYSIGVRPDWRHLCFVTNRTHDLALVEAEHRDHAVVERVIADLKDQALVHFPSASFTPTAPGP
jgi:hypothetical protein